MADGSAPEKKNQIKQLKKVRSGGRQFRAASFLGSKRKYIFRHPDFISVLNSPKIFIFRQRERLYSPIFWERNIFPGEKWGKTNFEPQNVPSPAVFKYLSRRLFLPRKKSPKKTLRRRKIKFGRTLLYTSPDRFLKADTPTPIAPNLERSNYSSSTLLLLLNLIDIENRTRKFTFMEKKG